LSDESPCGSICSHAEDAAARADACAIERRRMTSVRAATPADAAAIAGVHVRSWQVAYRGIVPDEILDGLSVPDREQRWRSILVRSDEDAFTLVAERDGRIAGFCSLMAQGRDGDLEAGTGEIAAVYVDPRSWRAGVGSALLAAALKELHAAGCAAATLWVFARNDRALAFYRGFAFAPDGGATTDERSGEAEVRLRARLPT
jgi:ribosomal protein S18 acetylase RimI-like enzyme